MTSIHKLETFTADDPDLGPSSILVLKGFEGSEDIRDFLNNLCEPKLSADSEVWRAKVVCSFTGLSETTIRKKVLKKEFPPPIDLGDRAKGWIASEVIAWRKARPRRWIGEIRKPVALRKNKTKLSAHNEHDTSPAELAAGNTAVPAVRQSVPA